MGGLITEAEAYMGEGDLGCHAKAGKTPRTSVMYGPPGRAYVYFTYGMHWMLNAVTCPENQPAAVLIRSILPQFGVDHMQKFRPFPPGKTNREKASDWTDGPAKLCQALNITREQNAVDLCSPDFRFIYCGCRCENSPNSNQPIPADRIEHCPRTLEIETLALAG